MMTRDGRIAGATGFLAVCVLVGVSALRSQAPEWEAADQPGSALGVPMAAAAARSQAPEPTLVIQGGNIIDVRRGTVLPGSTVVVRGERIAEVGPAGDIAVPPGAQVIDAAGKFVMPGLWDAHVHTRDFDGILNINHGVTATMDLGNILDWIHALAESREKRMTTGPLIFPQGMSISGQLGPHQWNATTPEEARWAARQNIEAGAAFLKVYGAATLEMVEAVVEEANKAGLNVIGHGGRTDARELALAGVTMLAHGNGVPEATAPPEIAAQMKRTAGRAWYDQADPARFDDLIELLVERHVRYEPNLVQVYRGVYDQWDQYQLEFHRLSMHPVLYRQIDELFVRMWSTDFPGGAEYPFSPEEYAKRRKALENQRLFTKKFAAAGGKLLVGSDNYYHMAAGQAVWQEMELLADAGVPNAMILQAATINAAEYVRQDGRLGTIEPGKVADIIILEKNPLEDVTNIRSLEKVIQHGEVQELGYHVDYRNPIPRPYQRVNSELPRPYISSVQPSGVPIGTRNLVLTVKGRDFDARNRVLWDQLELRVLSVTPTEMTVAVPDDRLRAAGTYRIHMITGGRVHQPSWNFAEVMVTFGRKFNQRWNGQAMSIEF